MKEHTGVCPWQAGPMLTISLRKLFQNPRRILKPYLSEGMTAADVGCAMGYFTIPMSGMAGESGKVIAVDLQPQMLEGLMKNAVKAGAANITPHQCGAESLRLGQWDGAVDFALIFWMLHEVPDAERLVRELHAALSSGGKLLFVEPSVHVGAAQFQSELAMIKNAGFEIVDEPKISISRAAVLQKL